MSKKLDKLVEELEELDSVYVSYDRRRDQVVESYNGMSDESKYIRKEELDNLIEKYKR